MRRLPAGRSESRESYSAGKAGNQPAPGAGFIFRDDPCHCRTNMIEENVIDAKPIDANMTEQKRPAINWMDILWLLFLAGLAALPPVGERSTKQLTLLGHWSGAVNRGLVLGARSAARPSVYCPAQDRAGDFAHRSHRRSRDQQQLLADLLSCRWSPAAEYFSPVGDAALDGARFRRLLFVSLSRATRI